MTEKNGHKKWAYTSEEVVYGMMNSEDNIQASRCGISRQVKSTP